MAGMRHLTDDEFSRLLAVTEQAFTWQIAHRFHCMFSLQAATGLRAKEICTIMVRDVASSLTTPNDFITVQKRNLKVKRENRMIPASPLAKRAIASWLSIRQPQRGDEVFFSTTELGANRHVEKGFTNKPVHVCNYVKAFDRCAKIAEIPSPVNTHSLRKLFAVKFHEATGHNLVATSRALGHTDIKTTIAYLQCADELVNDTILALFA